MKDQTNVGKSASRWLSLGRVGSHFTCSRVSNVISLTPRPNPSPTPTALPSFQKQDTQRWLNSVSLCSVPYTCRAPRRTGSLWVGVLFAYRVVANKPSITEIHKKKRNERQKQIAWGMGGINPGGGFLFLFSSSTPSMIFLHPFYPPSFVDISLTNFVLFLITHSEWNFLTRQNYPVTMETLAVRTWRPGMQLQHWSLPPLSLPHLLLLPLFYYFQCPSAATTTTVPHPSFTPASGLRQEALSSQLLYREIERAPWAECQVFDKIQLISSHSLLLSPRLLKKVISSTLWPHSVDPPQPPSFTLVMSSSTSGSWPLPLQNYDSSTPCSPKTLKKSEYNTVHWNGNQTYPKCIYM